MLLNDVNTKNVTEEEGTNVGFDQQGSLIFQFLTDSFKLWTKCMQQVKTKRKTNHNYKSIQYVFLKINEKGLWQFG